MNDQIKKMMFCIGLIGVLFLASPLLDDGLKAAAVSEPITLIDRNDMHEYYYNQRQTNTDYGRPFLWTDAEDGTTIVTRVDTLAVNILDLLKFDDLVFNGNEFRYPVKVLTAVDGYFIEMQEGVDYTISYKNNINAGTGHIIIQGIGDYTGTIDLPFKIGKATIVHSGDYYTGVVYTGVEYVYSGTPKCISKSIVGEHFNFKQDSTGGYRDWSVEPRYIYSSVQEGRDYTVTYQNNVNAGTARAIYVGKGNYKGKVVVEYTIDPRPVSATAVSVNQGARIYNKAGHKPNATVTVAGKTLKKDRDYSITYRNNLEVGTANILVRGKGNYTGTVKKTFRIIPDRASVKVRNVKKVGSETGMTLKPSKSIVSPTTYQFQIAKDKKFRNIVKTKKVSYTKVKKKKFKLKYKIKLKKGKRYYLRARVGKKVKGVMYYGPWSRSVLIKGK